MFGNDTCLSFIHGFSGNADIISHHYFPSIISIFPRFQKSYETGNKQNSKNQREGAFFGVFLLYSAGQSLAYLVKPAICVEFGGKKSGGHRLAKICARSYIRSNTSSIGLRLQSGIPAFFTGISPIFSIFPHNRTRSLLSLPYVSSIIFRYHSNIISIFPLPPKTAFNPK